MQGYPSRPFCLRCFSFGRRACRCAVRLQPTGTRSGTGHRLPDAFFSQPKKADGRLKLLVDGKAAFDEILQAIDAAQSSIHVQTYIWKDDDIGRQVVTRLKTAANRGVKVTVRKDALGTAFELLDMLKGRPSPVFTKSGLRDYKNIDVNVDVFADTDHSKYFIVDHKEVIFGGMNIADEYHTKWHDYMVRIQRKRWAAAFENRVLTNLPWPDPAPFVITLNNRSTTEIRTALIELISHAKESLVIEHAYFSDDKVIEAVKLVAGRGIQVRLMSPYERQSRGNAWRHGSESRAEWR